MCICSKISRVKLYNKNYEPDELIILDTESTKIDDKYESLVTLLGTIYLQDKGGQGNG